MSSVSVLAASFWVVVCAGIAVLWLTIIRRWIRRTEPRHQQGRVIADFAMSQGWDYQAADWLDLGYGEPFDAGEDPWCTNVVRGELDGREFTAFEYDVQSQVFMIELPESLPFLEVRPRTLAEEVGLGHPSFDVESIDFNERWIVHATSHEYALAVLQPVLMSDFMAGPELSWRIYDRRLVAWRAGELEASLILPAVQWLRRIENSTPGYVWADYAERATTPNPGDILPSG